MAANTRKFRCRAESVFEVFSDGWLYPSWVVGASRMRDVDDDWPREGATIKHSVGVWPLLIDDTTTMRTWEPPHRMEVRAKGWPLGEAWVRITVVDEGDSCTVRIDEKAVKGPAKLLPRFIHDFAFRRRNAETLKRLAYLAEGRQGQNL